jgi:G3E family GTPase
VKVHLVGGFLGSGKTTAIAHAAKQLTKQQIVSGVVTNDQGRYLIDSKFMDLADIATVEVTGGCFCCNFNQLDSQIKVLTETVKPDVIFAESVGSCTDLVATVLKPLLKFHAHEVEAVTYSGFADARMLLQHLQGKTLPFSPETNYIWEKQIEEAEILIVNKIDLLQPQELTDLKTLADHAYSQKTILFQNSLNMDSIRVWLETLAAQNMERERKTIDVDYQTYGAGEANLAWLDEEITITSPFSIAAEAASHFIDQMVDHIGRLTLPIGHLKFFLSTGSESAKISFTTIMGNAWKNDMHIRNASKVTLGINARIQTTPDNLRAIVAEEIDRLRTFGNITVEERNISYFQPGFPKPTHRMIEQ